MLDSQNSSFDITRVLFDRVKRHAHQFAYTSFMSPQVYMRDSHEVPGVTVMTVFDDKRPTARVKVELATDTPNEEVLALAEKAGATLGMIVRRMDKDLFGRAKVIESGGRLYFERNNGTCKGLAEEEEHRYKASTKPFDEPDDDKHLKPGPWPIAYHDPAFTVPQEVIDKRKEEARLTREAKAAAERLKKEQEEADEQRLAQEKTDFYERSAYGIF